MLTAVADLLRDRRTRPRPPTPPRCGALPAAPCTRPTTGESSLRVEEKKFQNLEIGRRDYGSTRRTAGARETVARAMSERVLVPLGSTTSFTSLGDGRELMLARGVARGAAASPAEGRVSAHVLARHFSRRSARWLVARALA